MGESAWEIVTFTLNAILFTLIGLQLRGSSTSSTRMPPRSPLVGVRHLADGARRACSGSTPPRSCRGCSSRASGSGPDAVHATLALITWSGMRGAVSLAAALAIPLTIDTGEPFPRAT